MNGLSDQAERRTSPTPENQVSYGGASLAGMPARISDPEQLKELLGIPFTPEQMACVTAPPAPR